MGSESQKALEVVEGPDCFRSVQSSYDSIHDHDHVDFVHVSHGKSNKHRIPNHFSPAVWLYQPKTIPTFDHVLRPLKPLASKSPFSTFKAFRSVSARSWTHKQTHVILLLQTKERQSSCIQGGFKACPKTKTPWIVNMHQ